MEYTIKVTAVRTTDIGNLVGVIKQVDWSITGILGDLTYTINHTTELLDPKPEQFVELDNLTESEVIQWIEAVEPNLETIKLSIAQILERELAKTVLVDQPLPWVTTNV